VLVFPANNQTGVATSMTFIWKKSTDPNQDAVKYHVMYGTDPNLVGAQTVDVASAASKVFFAGLGSMGAGFILFGFVSGGGGLKGSRKLLLVVPVLLLMGALFTACGGGGGGTTSTVITPGAGETSTTVTGLAANTTYFWKVVADDGKGGQASSAIFTFKTQ
jgi:hypothetical protein